jgi:hypothetical protein
MAEQVETAIYRLSVEGQDKIDRLTQSIDGLSTAVEPANGRTRTFSQTLQNLIGRSDETVGGLNRIQKAWETYERFAEAGAGSQTQLAALLDITTKKVNEQAVALENMRRAQANSAAGSSPLSTAGPNPAAYAAEFDKLIEIAHLKALQAGKNFQDTLNASFGNFGAGAIKSARDSFAAFEEAGAIPKANAGMVQLGNNTKVARYELINLGRQANDVVVSLASGQSLLMVGIQQGSQIWDVFTSSERKAADIFKQIGTGIVDFVSNPLVAAGAGVVALTALVAALAVQYDKVDVAARRATSGAGARTGTTTSDINAFVDKNTPSAFSGSSLSQKESRALGEGLTQTGDIVISKLQSMSAAVVGFSNQTGQSMDEAVKAFIKLGADPKKALDDLKGAFGPFSQATRDIVDDAVIAGDKTRAWNAILEELGPTAKGTAGNLTDAERATRGFINALQTTQRATGLEQQLAATTKQLDGLIESANKYAQSGTAAPPELVNSLAAVNKKYEELYARQQAVIDQRAGSAFNDVADKARVATDALIPQIEQLKLMATRLNELKAARDAGDGGPNNSAAITAQENLIAKTQESQAVAARYNDRVKEISGSWGDVGQSTALSLKAASNMLPVYEAVGGAAKMAAQYTADFKNAMDKGKGATAATALASSNLAASQAQANSAAKEQLFNLQNQAAASAAVTGSEQISAQATATKNSLLNQGVGLSLASAVAAQHEANARAAATAAVYRQVQSVKDQIAMIRAEKFGTEAATAGAIAYRNAIDSGASASAAAALKTQTIKLSLEQTGGAAESVDEQIVRINGNLDIFNQGLSKSLGQTIALGHAATSWQQAMAAAEAEQNSWQGNLISPFQPDTMPGGALSFVSAKIDPSTGLWDSGGAGPGSLGGLTSKFIAPKNIEILQEQLRTQGIPDAYAKGGADGALAAIRALGNTEGGEPGGDKPLTSIVGDKISLYDQFVQLKNSQTTDKASQATNIRDEIGFLQGLPGSVERDQKIADLTQSINGLITSTDSLTKSNQDLLSPYYTQDPRTSHIGFRSQGMASGGWVDVPGAPSSNDNMIAQIPVAGGERILVDPNRSVRGGGNSGGTVINISAPMTFNGPANRDEVGRTVFQNMQNVGRQIAATQ